MQQFLASHSLVAIVAVMAMAAGSQPAMAQLPVSRQTGIVPVPMKGDGSTNLVAAPFYAGVVSRETVTSATSSEITASGAAFGDLVSEPHSVVLIGPAGRGQAFPISGNTATTVTVSGVLPALSANDSVDIVEDWTLNKLFGPGNAAGLSGSTSSASADQILIVNEAGTSLRYWYKSGGLGGTGWRATTTGNTDQGNVRLGLLNFGMLVTTAALTSDKTLNISGIVRSGQQVLAVENGTGFYSWPFNQPDLTLATSALEATLAGSTSSASADLVLLEEPAGELKRYWYKNGGLGGVGWRRTDTGNTDQGSTTLPAGKAIGIVRLGGRVTLDVLEPFSE